MTFEQLKLLSFAHSAIYLTLLCVWLDPRARGRRARLRLGARHRLDPDVAARVDAVRRRVIPLWLGVTVAVIGGVGPFAGTAGFVLQDRRRHPSTR